MKIMRLLVCGGREYDDAAFMDAALSRAVARVQPDAIIVIHGDARGADTLAKEWADKQGYHWAAVPALWNHWPRAAGPKRNSAMLILQPTHCVAFPGNRGTADMVAQCKEAGIPVWEPK